MEKCNIFNNKRYIEDMILYIKFISLKNIGIFIFVDFLYFKNIVENK